MPQDLTGFPIKDVYTSFLHVSSVNISENLEKVYDGTGNEVPISISTKGVSLSGDVTINNVKYPTNSPQANNLPFTNDQGDLEYVTFTHALTTSNISTAEDGVYSNPKITMTGGLISDLENNKSVKTFYTKTETLTLNRAREVIQEDWPAPAVGDVAFVINLVDVPIPGSGLQGLSVMRDVFRYVYSTNGWDLSVRI